VRDIIRNRFQGMQDDPIGFETAAIIDLARTGLGMMELLNLTPLNAEDRDRVLAALARLTRQDAS